MRVTSASLASKATHHGKLILCVCAVFSLISCGSDMTAQATDAEDAQEQMTSNNDDLSSGIVSSVGRLNFVMPHSFVEIGRSQRIYGTHVITTPLTDTQSAERLWAERIEDARQQHRASGASSSSFRQTTSELGRRNELGGGTSAPVVFFRYNADKPDIVRSEAAFATEEEFVNLRYPVLSAGKEENLLRLFNLIFRDYQANSAGGFSIGMGSLHGKPSVKESVRVALRDQDGECNITISTHTAPSTLSESRLGDLPSTGALNWDGTSLRLLEREDSVVMALRGETGVISIQDQTNQEASVEYSWFYAGEEANPFRPEIAIKMICDGRQTNARDRSWNAFLRSFEMRQT